MEGFDLITGLICGGSIVLMLLVAALLWRQPPKDSYKGIVGWDANGHPIHDINKLDPRHHKINWEDSKVARAMGDGTTSRGSKLRQKYGSGDEGGKRGNVPNAKVDGFYVSNDYNGRQAERYWSARDPGRLDSQIEKGAKKDQ